VLSELASGTSSNLSHPLLNERETPRRAGRTFWVSPATAVMCGLGYKIEVAQAGRGG